MAKFINYLLATLLTMLLCVVVLVGLSAASPQERAGSGSSDLQMMPLSHARSEQDLERIVSVIERKIGSRRMPEEAKEKLSVMERQDLRLIASLCDRIALSNDRAGTDIALLLVASLIVLT